MRQVDGERLNRQVLADATFSTILWLPIGTGLITGNVFLSLLALVVAVAIVVYADHLLMKGRR